MIAITCNWLEKKHIKFNYSHDADKRSNSNHAPFFGVLGVWTS